MKAVSILICSFILKNLDNFFMQFIKLLQIGLVSLTSCAVPFVRDVEIILLMMNPLSLMLGDR